jgi:hypothetical protein
MPKLAPQTVLASLKSFAAAMLALYVAFVLDLPRPYWAIMTVYITSQPFSGAVRSKAVYRMAGTLIGAAAVVVLVPNLVESARRPPRQSDLQLGAAGPGLASEQLSASGRTTHHLRARPVAGCARQLDRQNAGLANVARESISRVAPLGLR